MNKNIMFTAAAAVMAFAVSLSATAQTAAGNPGQTRRTGLLKLNAVPGERTVAGQISKPLRKAAPVAADATAGYYGRTLFGTLINSTDWANESITTVPYGIYSFEMGANPEYTKHATSFAYEFLSGAYYRGKYFGITQMSVMGALNGARYITIDTDTWTEEKNVMYDTSRKRYSLLPSSMAYNPVDDMIYAFMYKDDLSGLDWCVYNREYDEMDKIASFRGKYNVLALAAVPSGDMYFINAYGDLYRINKATGRPTMVNWTGVTPILYSQSMTYDNRTGLLLWAAQTSEGSAMYTVDPETAAVQKIISFRKNEQFTSLYSIESSAKDDAPAKVEDLQLAYEAEGGLSGTISFSVPTTTYGGEPLGKSELNVWLDGVNVKGGDVSPGDKVSLPVTLEEGNHYVSVNLKNAGGWSPLAYVYQYAGYDVPLKVTDLVFTHEADGTNNVTWTAPAGGVNKGYVDFGNLCYTVVRMPDSVTVATDLKEAKFSEPVPDAMHNYSYRVYAINNGKRGAYEESAKVICGNAFTVPYSQNFSDASTFTDFYIIVDGNKDGNTWRAGYGGDVRIDINKNNNPKGDDWLITPGISMDEAAMYRYTINMKTFSKGYPESFEVYIGTDPKDLATFKKVVSEEAFELYNDFSDYNAEFFVDTPGRYYIALHYTGDAEKNSTMMMIKSVSVSKVGAAKAPMAVENLTVTPDAGDAMAAEISFTTPTKALDGSEPLTITKVNIYRNGGAIPIHTFDNPQTGASLSFNDTKVDKVGVNTYTVVGENGQGVGAAVDAQAFIGVYSAPYLETFDDKSAVSLYKSTISGLTEENIENSLWKYSDYNKCLTISAFNNNETEPVEAWLYTPKFKLDANSVYSFAYKANINLYSETITNNLYMGTDATPEAQTTELGALPRSTGWQKMPVSHNVVTTDAGKFFFGVHTVSTKQFDYIMADIDDISLTYLKSAFSPFKFTGYKAAADKNGNLSVDMQFKMPETDYQGNKLSGNLKVEVYRGQSPTPVYSDNNAVPGQLVKWTDTQAQHGKNTYMIVAENSYGRSEVLTDTLFVGRDAADLVLDLACKATPDNKDAVLSWKAPEEGANGGVIVESEMSYNIYSYDATTQVLTLIKEGVKNCTYTVENEPLDEQKYLYYAVSPVNTEGEGRAYVVSALLGKLYGLPFKESFAGKDLTTRPWDIVTTNSSVYTWGIANPDGEGYNGALPQDNDNGVAYMYNGNYYETFGGAGFVSPKISLGGENAVLRFWVYNIATAYPNNAPQIQVLVNADDGSYLLMAQHTVGSDVEDGWKQYEVPLSRFKSSSFIGLAFLGFTGGGHDVIYLDNIVVEKSGATSIDNAAINGKPVGSIRYYDVSGRELKAPQKGVSVRVVTYTDGTVESSKVIMK